ncbi:Tetratricopeptide repeat protein [compost metagenome]
MFKIITLISCITLLSHIPLSAQVQQHTPAQQAIIEKYLNKGAYQHHYTSHEWTDYINAALSEDSTIALLWHHKALPLWKTMRYEMALSSFDKAVQYSRKEYLGRRGFLKCIFQKNYNGAITDLEAAKKEFGLGYENDHSYDFYIALCHLQLGRYEEARRVLLAETERTEGRPAGYKVHYLELFFMGIIHYELRDYNKAINYFDLSIGKYPQFSDAKYYKAICYLKNGEKEKYHTLIREAKADYDKGLTISEDSRFYEQYPYQVNWAMVQLPE